MPCTAKERSEERHPEGISPKPKHNVSYKAPWEEKANLGLIKLDELPAMDGHARMGLSSFLVVSTGFGFAVQADVVARV